MLGQSHQARKYHCCIITLFLVPYNCSKMDENRFEWQCDGWYYEFLLVVNSAANLAYFTNIFFRLMIQLLIELCLYQFLARHQTEYQTQITSRQHLLPNNLHHRRKRTWLYRASSHQNSHPLITSLALFSETSYILKKKLN